MTINKGNTSIQIPNVTEINEGRIEEIKLTEKYSSFSKIFEITTSDNCVIELVLMAQGNNKKDARNDLYLHLKGLN